MMQSLTHMSKRSPCELPLLTRSPQRRQDPAQPNWIPEGDDFVASNRTFVESIEWRGAQVRRPKLHELGLGRRTEFELNFGKKSDHPGMPPISPTHGVCVGNSLKKHPVTKGH
jgi:hypothetical protein